MATGKRTKQAGKLTEKQTRFVEEYIKDGNAYQSAQRAGYAESTARSQATLWVRKNKNECPVKYHHVWDAVQAAREARSERTKIDADWVLEKAQILVERCLQEVNPATTAGGKQIYDGEGNPLFTFNASGVAKGLEIVGKHIAVNAFKENIEMTGRLDVADILMKARQRKRATLLGQAKEEKDASGE